MTEQELDLFMRNVLLDVTVKAGSGWTDMGQ